VTTDTQTRPTTPYERIGGREVLRAIVDRFYDLMDEDPAYAELRAMHAPDLAPMRESLTGFMTGWSGGPRDWFDGGKCVMGLHRPLAIGADTARQWVIAMRRAIDETVAASDPEIAKAMGDVLEQMAGGMIKAPAGA
jgi:hemoglobin